MPTDHLLNTLLDRFQDAPDASQTDSFLATTVHLLATLSNPLNLGVLTTEFLAAPAIWHHDPAARSPHSDLATCMRVISVYNAGGARVRAAVREKHGSSGSGSSHRHLPPPQPQPSSSSGEPPRRRIGCDTWARGIAAGLDAAHSRRWQHLLVLTGVLLGLETEGGAVHEFAEPALSPHVRRVLEDAVVRAANLSLETESPLTDGPVAGAALVLALGYALPLLSPPVRAGLDCDALLPLAVWAVTATPTFDRGAFLVPIAADVASPPRPPPPGAPPALFHWPIESPSFYAISDLASSPLVASLGPASAVVAHAVQHARAPLAVRAALGAVVEFSTTLLDAWKALPFSALDPAEEPACLSPETAATTVPLVWDVLKKVMFSVVAVLQAVAARSLVDPALASDVTVPVAILRALRALNFVSSRDANAQFQVYSFTYLAAVDVLSRQPRQCEDFLRHIAPPPSGVVPAHAADRALDLFYLNLVEHLPLTISPEATDALVIRPALTYLNPPVADAAATAAAAAPPPNAPTLIASSPLTAELFEAAHSSILSALSVPRNAALAVELVPFYADTLSAAFPSRISPRQFRLALRTVVRITSPPFPASASHPDLAEALLEMVRHRALAASQAPLPPSPGDAAVHAALEHPPPPASEQSTLVMAVVDAVPYLPLRLVDEWLTIAAELLGAIRDPAMRASVRDRFWEMLVSGEMDVDRAAMGVVWWGSGGRELVMGGPAPPPPPPPPPMMRGALQVHPLESKL
jgi:hypothetical protein